MTRRANVSTALLAALLASSGTSGAEKASLEPTIQLFLQACATSYAHAELVESGVRSFGLREISGDAASGYLGGASGRVWAGLVESKRFVVALRPEVLCSVVAHDGSGAEIKAAVESWLPPSSSGISVKKDLLPSPANLETTSYELRGGKVRERWLVTISSDPDSSTRAMLSWGPL